MPRVVTMIASATEIVCALGASKMLVGRSHECDYPPEIISLPITTQPSIKTEGTSSEIDNRIKHALRNALSVYTVIPGKLAKLHPDIIITQTQCEVCAVSLDDVKRALLTETSVAAEINSLHPDCLDDLWQDIQRVADALDISGQGQHLVAALQDRMNSVSQAAKQIVSHPRVAAIEWIEPLMAAGNWMPELIECAGGVNLFGAAGKHAPVMSFEDLANDDPDILLILPCGWDIARARSEMAALTECPQWPHLAAVKADRVFLLDGNQYFNRPGPRLAESLEILYEIFSGDYNLYDHRGVGWEKY